MIEEIRKHVAGYILLMSILVVAVVFYMWFWPDLVAQRIVAGFLGLSYFIWGVFTHYKTKTATKKILTEYLGIALIGTVIAMLLTV